MSLSATLLLGWAAADSAGDYDLPGPGLAYGGIPYGSVSGRVAEYYRRGGAVYNYKPGVSTSRGYKNNYYDFFSQDFD
ncbi:hypothetical protein J6590_061961 [Homalodisca vitripennis]|nr:hypothetical protein J6590_061961 [Homalodisca vitripennis]